MLFALASFLFCSAFIFAVVVRDFLRWLVCDALVLVLRLSGDGKHVFGAAALLLWRICLAVVVSGGCLGQFRFAVHLFCSVFFLQRICFMAAWFLFCIGSVFVLRQCWLCLGNKKHSLPLCEECLSKMKKYFDIYFLILSP